MREIATTSMNHWEKKGVPADKTRNLYAETPRLSLLKQKGGNCAVKIQIKTERQ